MTGNYHFILLVTWIHIVAMVGAMGGLLFVDRLRAANAGCELRPAMRLFNVAMVIGLVAGLFLYLRFDHASRYHMVVGIKMLLLLIAGAGAGMSSAMARKGRPAAEALLRRLAIAVMALAALLGVFLPAL